MMEESFHRFMLRINHAGRTKFFTQEEYERLFGPEMLEDILQDFGSWKGACEYLKTQGMDLEYPTEMQIEVPDSIAGIVSTLDRIKRPADFSQVVHVREAMVACLESFHKEHGFVPTIDQAQGEYKAYFPNVRHYLETFGTWQNACKQIPGIKPNEVPDFGKELKTTVNYYNVKHGKNPGTLMHKKEWDNMVDNVEKGKDIPHSWHMINYVKVERNSLDKDMPQNGWQAVAEAADLDVDRRGRPQEFRRLYDRDKIIGNYTGACVKNGEILTLQGWKLHCIATGRGYRPPDDKFIESIFGSVEELQMEAVHRIQQNEKHVERFLAKRELNAIEREAAATRKTDIWERMQNLQQNENNHDHMYERNIH